MIAAPWTTNSTQQPPNHIANDNWTTKSATRHVTTLPPLYPQTRLGLLVGPMWGNVGADHVMSHSRQICIFDDILRTLFKILTTKNFEK